MNDVTLLHGDCLELMKGIPDGSIDMILCDLPYGTIKGIMLKGWNKKTTEWDEKLNTESLFIEYERILRRNGTIILFSQEPYTNHLRGFNKSNLPFLIQVSILKLIAISAICFASCNDFQSSHATGSSNAVNS